MARYSRARARRLARHLAAGPATGQGDPAALEAARLAVTAPVTADWVSEADGLDDLLARLPEEGPRRR